MQAFYRVVDLPWSLSAEDEAKFRRFLAKIVGTVLVLSLIMPFLPVPEKDLDAAKEVPPRYAKLLMEKKAPPPPPPIPEPIEQLEPEPLPEPEKVVEKKPEPEPEPEPVVEVPKPDPTELARENAKKAGVLAFADDLADLRDLDSVASVTDNRNLVGAAAEAGRSERSLITSSAGKSSGGINTASLSRDTGGAGGLSARNTTKVGSPIASQAASRAAKKRKERETGVSARSREEIEMIFDRNKGAIFALYNRALRRDPTLQGKLVLKLTIAPSGKVTACEVVSSELADPDLEQKLVRRVKLFDFGAKDVSIMTTTKPIDFFPA